MAQDDTSQIRIGAAGRHWALRYGVAALATGVALGLWFISPIMHQDPFALFLAAVIVSARFFGFGPALFCTALSVLSIDYFVFQPHFTLALTVSDLERLVVFVVICVVGGSIARQRSRAEIQADEARRRMAAIVESSDDSILSTDANGTITSWNRGGKSCTAIARRRSLAGTSP